MALSIAVMSMKCHVKKVKEQEAEIIDSIVKYRRC